MDSNQRMQESKSCALPLGDSPTIAAIFHFHKKTEGGYRDSNPGPPEPQSGTLTNCAIPTIFYHSNIKRYNVPEGIRTPDPRLRRPLLYPAELRTQKLVSALAVIKRVMGIEPTYLAWKASVLPLNYTRINKLRSIGVTGFEPATS